MRALPVIHEVKKKNSKLEKDIFGPESLKHPGRMPLELAVAVLEHYDVRGVVSDPMSGIGSTGIGALSCGVSFYGQEIDPIWASLSSDVLLRKCPLGLWASAVLANSAEISPPCPIDMVFTSPPFPNAHSPGRGEAQVQMIEALSTHAGTEYDLSLEGNLAIPKAEDPWKELLFRILNRQVVKLRPDGLVIVHIKNFVRKNVEIRADLWVKDVLESLGGYVLGYHPVPLLYESLFNTIQRMPLRSILERREVSGGWEERLACGDWKFRSAKRTARPDRLPKKARCAECPTDPSRVIVSEERLVVARF